MAFLYLVPADSTTLIGYLKGLQYELSIGSLILYFGMCCRKINGSSENRLIIVEYTDRSLDGFRWVVLLSCLVIYPMALGVGLFDPYAIGYSSTAVVIVAFSAMILFSASIFKLVAWWLAIGLIAYLFDFGESNNLVDYLVDGFTLLSVAFWLLAKVTCLVWTNLRQMANARSR